MSAASSGAGSARAPAPPPPATGVGYLQGERFLVQLVFGADALLGGLAIPAAVVARDQLVPEGKPIAATTWAACLALLVIALALLAALRVRYRRVPGLGGVMQAFALATLLAFSGLFLVRHSGDLVSRPALGLYALIAAAAASLVHTAGLHFLRRSRDRQPVHVVAIGRRGELLPVLGQLGGQAFRAVPIFSDGIERQEVTETRLGEVFRALRDHTADEVLLMPGFLEADPKEAEFLRGVVSLCEETGVHLRIWMRWVPGHSRVYLDYLGATPVLTFASGAVSPWALSLKRLGDLVLGGLLLVATSPLLLIAATAIKLDSRGPVFFSQTRCGLRGRPFRAHKLRTMCVGADEMKAALAAQNELQGPVFKMRQDPRVTRVGRWLRKASLDEIPQLWNVIRGEMSLVGPRPPSLDETELYPPGYFRRLAMKPGITGLWQVSGRTSIANFEQWVEIDSHYIRNWSLWLDIKIMLRTVWVVLRMTGR